MGHHDGDQYALVTFRIHQEDGYLVSTCPELDVSSFGRTVDEAIRQLADALTTHVTALEEEGILMSTLEERGVEVRSEPFEAEIKVSVHTEELVTPRLVPVFSALSAGAGAGV